MKSYLSIFEDGAVTHFLGSLGEGSLGEGVLDACDNGICQRIDITDPKNPLDYYNGTWTPIKQES
jgi:hypothetical protein